MNLVMGEPKKLQRRKFQFVEKSFELVEDCQIKIFSLEPRLYKRVRPSVGPLVGLSISLSVRRKCNFLAGSDKMVNNLFHVN